MNKINRSILTAILTLAVFSCSSVKLKDSWSSNDFKKAHTNKILVIARSTDSDVRKVYEETLVTKLKKEGVNAVSALELFPNLKEKSNRSQEEIDDIVKMFKREGINSIMLTALKNKNIETSQPDKLTDNTISTSKIGKYGISFADYYNVHSIEYLSKELRPGYNVVNDNSNIQPVLSSTTYTLEAVVYDLTLEANKQLIGTFEVEATDPSSAKQVLTNFTSIISTQFKN